MADLRACFVEHGFQSVATYIQSGNVVFSAGRTERASLVRRIEAMLAASFRYDAAVAVRSEAELRAVVERAPRGFGAEPGAFRYDVVFLREPLTAQAAIESVPARPGVDEVHAGTGVLYFSRLVRRASQSKLAKLTSLPVYQEMTVRNWNTTTTLLRMAAAEESDHG